RTDPSRRNRPGEHRAAIAVTQVPKRGVGVGRLAEQAALAPAAATLHQPLGLRLLLYSFRHHVHAQALAHGEYGADDVFRRTVIENGGYEGAVDLQLVEMEFAQDRKSVV